MAAVPLAGEHGGEGNTHSLNAVDEDSGEFAPGFFCSNTKIRNVWLGFLCICTVRAQYLNTVVVLPGVWEDPAVLCF